MNNPDQRQFIPPVLFRSVCDFAIREVMCHGIGEHGEHDYTVSDCLQVAMLYPRSDPAFRLPSTASASIATLYNSYADLQEVIAERKRKRETEQVLNEVRDFDQRE